MQVRSLGQKDPLEKEMANKYSCLENTGNGTPVFLPGKFHGQRSLAGYSPWGWQSQTQLSD